MSLKALLLFCIKNCHMVSFLSKSTGCTEIVSLKGNSKTVTRCAMLPNHNNLYFSILKNFVVSFFTEFATNALVSLVNRLIFATNFTEKLNFKPTHHFSFHSAKAPFQQKRVITICLGHEPKSFENE